MDRRNFLAQSGVIAAGSAAAIAAIAAKGNSGVSAQGDWTTEEPGAVLELDEVLKEREDLGRLYHPFLRVPGLHMGIYHLTAGAKDPQSPHKEDEVYLVVEGRGSIRIEEKLYPFKKGSLIYVEALAKHKFEVIDEDLTLLVFFASEKAGE